MDSGTTSERIGDAQSALRWISTSPLPDEEKENLTFFVMNYSDFLFFRDSPEDIIRRERQDRVKLPPWFCNARETLAFIHSPTPSHPPVLACFDTPDYDCSMSDSTENQWYQIKTGVMGEDDRELFVDQAGLYPIATWFGTDQSYLAINLRDPNDRRIYEFSGADYWDMSFNAESLEGSSQPAFISYARMLSHISGFKFPNGVTVSPGPMQTET
ncbi:hypothetical protein ACF1BP_24785 [Streptomyces sp. NPDC014735]|uniref:hypothetical protein n=1 Tax=unclassified Streptomyces TaxID=2593676 RepID=UPI003700A2FF